MIRRSALASTAALAIVVAARSVAAQAPSSSFSASASQLTVRSATEAVPYQITAGSVDGRLGLERFALVGGYSEGRIGSASAPPAFIEGHAGIAARLSHRFELRLGPLVRVTQLGGPPERVLHWRWTWRYEEALGPPGVAAFAEWWGASSRHSSAGGTMGRAKGGAAGVGWRGALASAQLEYAIDEVRLPNVRRQSVERITIRLGVGR